MISDRDHFLVFAFAAALGAVGGDATVSLVGEIGGEVSAGGIALPPI